MNQIIKWVEFPTRCKIADVPTRFKNFTNNDVNNPTSYRPIPVLTSFAKVFERLLHNQITEYISDNKILANHQYGFRKKKNYCNNTTDAIINITEK